MDMSPLPISVLGGQSATWAQRLRNHVSRIDRLFLVTVIAPTILASVYFGLIASDVYVSESRFVVRSPQRQVPSGLGALLQDAGFSRSQDDTTSAHDFMLSRDALQKLNDRLDLHKMFSSGEIDLFSRFAGLYWDDSFEALHRYYQKRVTIGQDTLSSISVLKVNAYRAEDAYRINEMLLQMGELLINQLNERARQDMIRFAKVEVEDAEQRAKTAALALSGYRNRNSVFDPERQSALQLQQIFRLQDEFIATMTQLVQVRTSTPDNPQIPSLIKRTETLQSEIDAQMAKVAGGSSSLTNMAPEYERLILERAFADKQLGATFASLEQALNEAQRKQLYLERIVQPNLPDVAVEPRGLRAVIATIVLGLIFWGVLTILIAGVREHRD
ncbi:MAG: capsule biosynthesis protein [Hyphomicrobiales bacterium]